MIPRHLGIIATSMIHWDGRVADELGLTKPERVDIAGGLKATYRALITIFIIADRHDCAHKVCETLLEPKSVIGKSSHIQTVHAYLICVKPLV